MGLAPCSIPSGSALSCVFLSPWAICPHRSHGSSSVQGNTKGVGRVPRARALSQVPDSSWALTLPLPHLPILRFAHQAGEGNHSWPYVVWRGWPLVPVGSYPRAGEFFIQGFWTCNTDPKENIFNGGVLGSTSSVSPHQALYTTTWLRCPALG